MLSHNQIRQELWLRTRGSQTGRRASVHAQHAKSHSHGLPVLVCDGDNVSSAFKREYLYMTVTF